MIDKKNLQGIPEFLRVVDDGSFSAAANMLNSSRSRVSQLITQLEKNLGVQLLHRSTRSIMLTDIGEQFYRQCTQGLSYIEQAIDQAQEDQQTLAGEIRINAVGGIFGEQILTPLLFLFMDQHPDVIITLDFSSVHVDLIAQHYDIVVRMGPLPDSNLIARPLTSFKTHVCASPEYLNKHKKISHPKDLLKHNIILGSVHKWPFTKLNLLGNNDKERDHYELTLKGKFHCANGHVSRLAVLNHQGIARLTDYHIKDDLAQGRLVTVFDDWQLNDSIVSLVYPQARYKILRVQALIDFLLHSFGR